MPDQDEIALSVDERVQAGVIALKNRHGGDADAALQTLYRENFTLREKRRQAEARIPAEGSVILDTKQAELFAQYQALGDITTLKTLQTQAAEAAELRRSQTLREAADLAGVNYQVLRDLVKGTDINVEVKDGKALVGGEALADYAKTHWTVYEPVLFAQRTTQGAPYPPQGGSQGKPAPTDLVADFVKQVAEASAKVTSPLVVK